MTYPFPGFSNVLFEREEHSVWGTDAGWVLAPSYNRQRPLGSGSDVINTLSVGSYERSFEIYLTASRFEALLSLLNTASVFTDWGRPVPDSRTAFLSEVSALDDVISDYPGGKAQRKRHTRVSLVSQ